jgi:hypothetical protein
MTCYRERLLLYNSEPSVAGWVFYNNLANNMKWMGNRNTIKNEMRDLHIKGKWHSGEDCLNEELCNDGYW